MRLKLSCKIWVYFRPILREILRAYSCTASSLSISGACVYLQVTQFVVSTPRISVPLVVKSTETPTCSKWHIPMPATQFERNYKP